MLLRLLLATGLGGCSFDEAVPDLGIPMPVSYREAARKPAPLPPVDWPGLFKSAELTRLVVEAEYQNLDIAAAVARIAEADAQARIDSAGLYPTLSGSANAQRSHSPGTLRSKAPPFSGSNSNQFSLGLTASYAIDFWGKNRAAASAGEWLTKANRFDRDVVALTAIVTVVNDYLTIIGDQDRLRIARDNIKIASRVLEAIKGRLSVGTATALDIAQQESVVATQRANVPPLEQELEQDKNLIIVLLGRAPETGTIRGGSLNALAVPQVAAGLPAQLLLRRPDIAEAEARLEAQNQSAIEARAAMLPNIVLTGEGGLESIALKNLLRPEAAFGSIAASLTQPILDGGTLAAQLELQKSTRTELLQSYRKAVISAFSDVENALIALRQTSEHERLQIAVVKASRRAQEITEARLHEGTIDVTTLLTTETTLFQAEDELSQIRLQRLQAIVSLFQALGGGFTPQIETPAAGETTAAAFMPVPIAAVSAQP